MKFNILSIDESGITRLELAGILKNLDINFINAGNEVDAVEILQREETDIDAIIWTMNSTNPGDLEAIKHIKSKDAYKHIPIIIVSGYTDKKYIIKAIEAGAIEYIAKPYDEDTVLRKVCKILGLSYEKTIRNNIDDDIVTYNFSEMFSREIKALLLLLPFADKPGISSIEQKIHDTFNNHSLIKRKNNGYKLITASVTFPEDGKVKDKLLEKLEAEFNKRLKPEQMR